MGPGAGVVLLGISPEFIFYICPCDYNWLVFFLATTKSRAKTICPSGLSISCASAMASETRYAHFLVCLDEHRADQCNDMREFLRIGEAKQRYIVVPERIA